MPTMSSCSMITVSVKAGHETSKYLKSSSSHSPSVGLPGGTLAGAVKQKRPLHIIIHKNTEQYL